MSQPSSRGAVMRNGLIFGAILAAMNVGGVITTWLAGGYTIGPVNRGLPSVAVVNTGVSAPLRCVNFLAALALPFVASMVVARRTGRVGAGSLAGLLAGSIGGLLGGVASFAATRMLIGPNAQAPAGSNFTQSQMQMMLMSVWIVTLLILLLAYGGIGAGLGALGGLVGANSYRKANPPAYQPAFYPDAPWHPGAYPGAPYPGPQYPGAPYAPPPPYAGPQYPTQPYPGQAGYPAPPAQPQEPRPPQQG